ncbi:hypothetical protein MTBBW1_2310018 [Desulfamplus magnetovallimortis]|uniref:Uncharacterized protein n=1 Tax=Desulfamplus magnetovallimortis TaxID=1246637 RepID=A0A1W1HDM3_9BACT|nr:hypothetical protein MTBBW1_2310018 [Desulfamplus magnetovallimortis]
MSLRVFIPQKNEKYFCGDMKDANIGIIYGIPAVLSTNEAFRIDFRNIMLKIMLIIWNFRH